MITIGKNGDQAICYNGNYINSDAKYVYHYTTSKNLFNILENLNIRLSHYGNHLDDPVDGYVAERLYSLLHCNVSQIDLNSHLSKYKFVSLTTNRDDIPNGANNSLLWYMYGDAYRGACIVFDQQKLHDSVMKKSQICKYINVEYGNFISDIDRISKDNLNFNNMINVLKWKESSWRGQEEIKLLCFSEEWCGEKDIFVDVANSIEHISLGFKFEEYEQLFDIIYQNYPKYPVKLFSSSFSSALFIRDNVEDGLFNRFKNALSNFPEYKKIDECILNNFDYSKY